MPYREARSLRWHAHAHVQVLLQRSGKEPIRGLLYECVMPDSLFVWHLAARFCHGPQGKSFHGLGEDVKNKPATARGNGKADKDGNFVLLKLFKQPEVAARSRNSRPACWVVPRTAELVLQHFQSAAVALGQAGCWPAATLLHAHFA
jgi:hypothetical protein